MLCRLVSDDSSSEVDVDLQGLAFSVRKGVVTPPSLKNMYKELETDIPGFKAPKHG